MQKQLLVIFTLLMLTQLAWGQNKDQSNEDPRYIIDPVTGRLSMVIRVWGEVKQPGVTMVPSDADLISLLSYVGGPTDKAKLENIRIIRFNKTPGEDRIVYADIDAFLETGDDSFIPKIYPNDTIVVKGTIWKTLSSFTPYISLGVTLIQAYYYFNIAAKS